jgi:hypothetical protein
VWPAADVVMTSPEAAGRDFMERAMGVPAVLGEFRQGDQRSGEIEVFVETDGGGSPSRWPRAVLFLRRLGPADGWFVIGAASQHVTITSPEVGAVVPPGSLLVAGQGRGFEATLVVEAFLPGQLEPLDQVVTFGGSLDTSLPYQAELDLSRAPPGAVVAIVTRGGVGLETDPGEFTAVPIRLAS